MEVRQMEIMGETFGKKDFMLLGAAALIALLLK